MSELAGATPEQQRMIMQLQAMLRREYARGAKREDVIVVLVGMTLGTAAPHPDHLEDVTPRQAVKDISAAKSYAVGVFDAAIETWKKLDQ